MRIAYFIIINVILVALFIKIIFQTYTAFFKAIIDHFFPSDYLPNPMNKWSDEHDIKDKINLIYAVALALAGINFVLYQFLEK